MEEQQNRRPRRLRAQRPPVLPVGRESAESVLPDLPRIGALDALLREVDNLRLSLETDLTLAAAAVEHGAPEVAADIIDSDRDGLRGFEQRALEHLAELARPKRRLRVPAAPFVAAAAVAAFVLGVVPHLDTQTPDTQAVSADSATESLNQLTTAASNGETAAAVAAANKMHAQLMALVARAKTDPVAAEQALELLRAEQFVLSNAGTDSVALSQALAASRRLTSRILLVLTTATPHSSPAVVVVAPSQRPAPTASPTPTSTTSAKPQPTWSPKPSKAPSPTPTGSPDGGGLPAPPGFS
jgi:hypothetical protein